MAAKIEQWKASESEEWEKLTWQDIRGNKQNKEEIWKRQQDLDPRPYFNTLMEKL